MWFANLIAGFMLLMFGLIIRFLKAADLIAGVNTASPKDRAKLDEDALCKFVGNMLIISSILLLLGGGLYFLPGIYKSMAAVSWVLVILIILVCAVYANTGNRFKKQA